MPLVLAPRVASRPPLGIDIAGILPETVRGRAAAEIAGLPIQADSRPCAVGDVFAVSGSADDGRMECRGDFSRVHHVGAGMSTGRIEVHGDVGRHAAAAMSGGTLIVTGSAGDWLACEMRGGRVRVGGDCGDNAAAALPGSVLGMRGGLVVVAGDVGCLAGARMRRGVLAVGGDCGAAVAFEMRAGTVLVAGDVGGHPAVGMRRGSLVALSATPRLPPTFARGATWSPAFLPLLLRHLALEGWPPAAAADGARPWRQWHGDLLTGGRGEVWCPEAA